MLWVETLGCSEAGRRGNHIWPCGVIGRSTPRKADTGPKLIIWSPPDIDFHRETTLEGRGDAELWECCVQGFMKSRFSTKSMDQHTVCPKTLSSHQNILWSFRHVYQAPEKDHIQLSVSKTNYLILQNKFSWSPSCSEGHHRCLLAQAPTWASSWTTFSPHFPPLVHSQILLVPPSKDEGLVWSPHGGMKSTLLSCHLAWGSGRHIKSRTICKIRIWGNKLTED